MNAVQMLQQESRRTFSRQYFTSFYDGLLGLKPSAAAYEGAPSNLEDIVPVFVDGTVIPFPADVGAIRRLAYVLPTTTDLIFAPVTSAGTVAQKLEGMPFGVSTSTFGGGVRLSAFMLGAQSQLSREIVSDIPAFLSRLETVLVPAQNAREEHLFLHGSGIGEPQGILGRVGTGFTAEPDAAGNLVSIEAADSLIDTLPAQYHANATWLMSRGTARGLRKAQRQQGMVDRVWSREDGRDMYLDFPVEYSEEMPDAVSGATPVLFGDFRSGVVLGDRGGPDISVKVLDQDAELALAGVISLLTFRRSDLRVLRPEAIQPLVCA